MSKPIISADLEPTAAEELVLAAAAKGEAVDLDGAEIRGSFLKVWLTGSRLDWPMGTSTLRISKAIIIDGLDFEGCALATPVVFSAVRIEASERGALALRDARLKRLTLKNCHLEGGIAADRVNFENGLLIAGCRVEGPVVLRGAQINGALAVEGGQIGDGREALQANGLHLSGPLLLRRARLKGAIKLVRAQLGAGLDFQNADIAAVEDGVDLESARLAGDILGGIAHLSGPLKLAHAHVGGRVDLAGASLVGDDVAIAADSVNIGQGLCLTQARIKGTVDVGGADICKGLMAESVEIEGGDVAIAAGGISVGGNWNLARAKLVGALNCPGAQIRGQFRLTEARLFGADLAIRADGAHIGGGCYMSRSMVFGLLRFPACEIGNQFRLRGASLKVERGPALMVNGSRFGRDVELGGGLESIGALVLDQVKIPGVLDFSQSRIKSALLARDGRGLPRNGDDAGGAAVVEPWDDAAISLADADVKRLCMPSTSDERPRGIVDLSRTRAASFQDFTAAWPPGFEARGKSADGDDVDHLVLDGFVYEHLNNPSGASDHATRQHSRADDRVGERRLEWLEGQQACDIRDHFKPQPWVQLEQRLMLQGYSEDGRQISIARRRLERSSHATRMFHRWQGTFLDMFALYGFNPWRTVAWMVIFVVFFAGIWAWAGGQCQRSGCPDETVFVMTNRDAYTAERFSAVYPDFNPLAYSFDVFVPFVSFGYADHWRPNMAWQPIAEVPQLLTFAPIEDKGAGGDAAGREGGELPTFKITLGGILYGLVIFETIIGIVLTSLLITGFTGLLRGD
ncbi:MAG: hypothetical protein RIC14_11270 [Filomicrobium sp.]